jgi:outer membrane protein OmpA-like peptidoglycan-associated protein
VPDTDGDGIDDDPDSCVTVKGTAKYHGCPIPDRDGDGINDEEDKCPDQPGDKMNQGCPAVQPSLPLTIAKRDAVQFKSASSSLTQGSYLALNELASYLITHRSVHLTIHGYTDNTGSPAFNLSLSKARAETVRKYLVGAGVDASQLTAVGHGQQDPVAANSSGQGKAINRRVEFKLEDTGKVK